MANDNPTTQVERLLAIAQACARPFTERIAKIQRRHHEWFERERERPGAVLTGGAPREVDEALEKVQTERQRALRELFEREQPGLLAGLAPLVRTASEDYAAHVESLQVLGMYHDAVEAFARACGVPAPRRLDVPDRAWAFQEWCRLADLTLHPPAVTPAAARPANRLDLSDL